MNLLVRNVRIAPDADLSEAIAGALRRVAPILPRSAVRSASLYRRSVDARKRDRVSLLCSVLIDTERTLSENDLRPYDAVPLDLTPPFSSLVPGSEPLSERPVVVGFGPCGMFCALLLAERSYRPIVLERGGTLTERKEAVGRFRSLGILDPETNIQFGAGGAGTFSDGKLMTRIHDPACRYVLETFHALGAPDDILTQAKPHIGTDILSGIVEKMGERITSLGGEILYHACVRDLTVQNGKIVSVRTPRGEIPCGALILCTGHSARDTFAMLGTHGVPLLPKAFSVGVRIEHPQHDIDEAMYGSFAGLPSLGHAEYQLSHHTAEGIGVYTFCMCPGGEVVAAASEEGGVVVNGMSENARSGDNANAAVAVSVDCALAESLGGGIAFQRRLERAAYEAGKGGGSHPYAAPCQRLDEFLSGRSGGLPTSVKPSYMAGNVVMTDLAALFPSVITRSLREGIPAMDRHLGRSGVFAAPSSVLTGIETRTSSPLRIPREEGTRLAIGFDNLYPCGEGAGYAGGITSAAADGLATAAAVIARFRALS